MSGTGFRVFDSTVQKTNLVLREIEEAYGWPPDRRMQSYTATRAVLHALRDRLPVQESADIAAQLPMLLRGLYYEGWTPARVPERMDRDEFLERVRREFNYSIDTDIETLVRTVIEALEHHVAQGQWEDVRATLPKEFASILE